MNASDFLDAEDEQPSKSAASFLDDEEPAKKPYGAKQLAGEAVAVGDMILGAPAALARMVATGVTAGVATVDEQEKPVVFAKEVVDSSFNKSKFAKFMSGPLSSLFESAGVNDITSGTKVADVGEWITEKTHAIAKKISDDENTQAGLIALGEDAGVLLGFKAGREWQKYKERKLAATPKVDDLVNEYMDIHEQKRLARKTDFTEAEAIDRQSVLPLENSIYDSPAYKGLKSDIDTTPQELKNQDVLDLTNKKPKPRQPDLFEPEAAENLDASNVNPIRPAPKDPNKIFTEVQNKQAELGLDEPTQVTKKQLEEDRFKDVPDLPENLQGESMDVLVKSLPKDEFLKEFQKRNPDKPIEAGEHVFDRLNPELKPLEWIDKYLDGPVAKGLRDYLLQFNTRIGDISKPLLTRFNKFHMDEQKSHYDAVGKADVFLQDLNKRDIPAKVKQALNNALLDSDAEAFDTVARINGLTRVADEYKANIKTLLDDIGKRLVDNGLIQKMNDNYVFPRLVKDYKGLSEKLGKETKDRMTAAIDAARKEANNKGLPFTTLDETAIINKFLRGYPRPEAYKAGYRKERKFDAVPDDLKEFYYPPTEALHIYIKQSLNDINTAEFFGKNKVVKDGKLDLDESIGEYVRREARENNLTDAKRVELEDLIRSRFAGGNRAMTGGFQAIRNTATASLLGDITTTAVNLGEVAMGSLTSQPTVMASLKGSIKAAAKTLAPKAKAGDIGLSDHISQVELADSTASKSARLADAMLKVNGFKYLDIWVKQHHMNTSLYGAEALLKTPKGRMLFEKEWKGHFGKDYNQLVRELQEGKVTPLTTLYTFSNLVKTQAISKGNWTKFQLDHPNGRIFYMLKNFMLTQLNWMRNESYRRIKEGDVKGGIKGLSKVTAAMAANSATGAGLKDWILGRENDDEFMSVVASNMLRNYALNDMMQRDLAKGDLGKAVKDVLSVPIDALSPAMTDAFQDTVGEGDSKQRYFKHIPIVGKTAYERFIREDEPKSNVSPFFEED